MAVRFSDIWLLIAVVFVVQLPVTRGQLCPPDWIFHDLTGSCITLIRENFAYVQARYYCQDSFRSNTTKRGGHLVFIFDKATDDFVKGLLDEQGLDKALIGLHDRARNGDYAWGDSNAIPASYTGWADNPHTADKYKHAVVMTTDGWQEYDRFSGAYFVCQVSVGAPEHCSGTSSPWFPAVVGAPSVSIKMCVRAYPAPTSFRLYKGNTIINRLRADKFQAYFNFTNEEDILGEITVMISPFTQADIGDYMLYSEYKPHRVEALHSYLKFSVFAQGTYQFKDPDSLSQIYTGEVDGAVSINVTVFGYPEPNVTLNSTKHILPSDAYTLNYTQLEPPYGTVSLVINIQNASFFQNYSLNIINTGGSLTYSFEIVESDTALPVSENGGSTLGDVGAIVVGIVTAVLVIIIICVIIFLLRRKGAPCKRKKHTFQHINDHATF